jgi:DNA-binding MarR family transcriptional regulator
VTARAPSRLSRGDLGFLLAKASQRWNQLLRERFVRAGFPEVRPAYGSILVPLFEDDGLQQGELGRRARLSKQTMTTMTRLLERDGLVERRPDPNDRRATLVFLTERARAFRPVAEAAAAELDGLAATALARKNTGGLRDALRLLIELEDPGGDP